jgi:hypothetical protein
MRQRRQLTIAILAAGLLLAGAAWLLIPSPRGPSYTPLNIKAMGDFDFDPAGGTLADVPPYFRRLDGKKVVIEGEPCESDPFASHDGDDLHFQLVYAKKNGRPPDEVQKRVFAHMPSVKLPSDFASGYVAAFGTLHVKPVTNTSTGLMTQVYSLDVDRLENIDGSSGASGLLSVWPLLSPWAKGMILTVLLALVAWLIGVLWYRRERAALRDPAAIPCPICGYDARGNTTSRCPECNALLGRR